MYDDSLFDNVLSKYIDEVALKTNATSIYLVGSFSTKNMWTLGMSDIDLKVFSSGAPSHGYIDITKEVFEYYKNNNYEQFSKRSVNNKEEVVLSYTVWNINDIQDENSWSKFYEQSDWYNSMIITDQLILMGHKELLYGRELDFVEVTPSNFRSYLNSLNSHFGELRSGFSMLNEIKIIIYSVRICFYLWTGKYIYDYDDLLRILQVNAFDDVMLSSLKLAIDLKKKINDGEIDTNIESKEYFVLTKKIIRERKILVDYLMKKDNIFCNEQQEQPIGETSILAQGVIV